MTVESIADNRYFRDVEGELRQRLAAAQAEWRLSRRERDTLGQIASGNCNKEIAVALSVHVGTVEHHVTSLLRKAGCDSRARLIARFWTTRYDPMCGGEELVSDGFPRVLEDDGRRA